MRNFWLFFCTIAIAGPTEFYIAVPPQTGTHQHKIILKNHHSEVAKFKLLIYSDKNQGYTSGVVNMVGYASHETIIEDQYSSFATDGSFIIKINASTEKVSVSCVISSHLLGDETSATAELRGIPRENAGKLLTFPRLVNYKNGFSGPLLLNVGEDVADVAISVFANETFLGVVNQEIGPDALLSRRISEMFPNADGPLLLSVESNQPLIGTAFALDPNRDPEVAPANTIRSR